MCDAIPMRASIALPCNGASLITTAYATRRVHRADPRGRTFRIADTAGESDFDIPSFRLGVAAPHSRAQATAAGAPVRLAAARLLMKGALQTDEFGATMPDHDASVRTERRLSQV